MSESMPQVSYKSKRRNGAEALVQVDHPSEVTVVPEEAIAKRAHDKFVARGCVHGGDQEDWTLAKNELLAEARKG